MCGQVCKMHIQKMRICSHFTRQFVTKLTEYIFTFHSLVNHNIIFYIGEMQTLSLFTFYPPKMQINPHLPTFTQQIGKLSIYIFLFAVFMQAILSWVNPYTPMASVLDALTRPILNPLRQRIPLAGGIDLSPLIVFICAQLLFILLIWPLEQQFARLL